MIELNKIYNEDNLITMSRMPDKLISGIICSPPYNTNVKRSDCYYNNGYSELDSLSEEEYLNTRINEFKEFERILNDRGVICYNISYHHSNPILPTLLMTKIHNETNLTVSDVIVWKKTISIPFQTSPTKLSRICEFVYVIVKKVHLDDYITNKKVSKINDKTGQKFYKGYNNLIEARNNDKVSNVLKSSYSVELVSKLINIYYPIGSLIYDPFMGIGTTARSCILNKLSYIGSEIKKEIYDEIFL